MSVHTAPAVTDWTAEGHRPAGQPGTVNRHCGAWSCHAVHTDDSTIFFWRDTTDSAGQWIAAPPMLAASFEPGPEWQARCDHFHGVAYRTCDSEAECDSLAREQWSAS